MFCDVAFVLGFGSFPRHLTSYAAGERVTVAKLQVGLLGSARQLQRDLDRIAGRADTNTPSGLHYVLQGSILALRQQCIEPVLHYQPAICITLATLVLCHLQCTFGSSIYRTTASALLMYLTASAQGCLVLCRNGAVFAQTSRLLHLRPGLHQQPARHGSWGVKVQCNEHGRAFKSEGGDTSECQREVSQGKLLLRVSHNSPSDAACTLCVSSVCYVDLWRKLAFGPFHA